MPKSSKNNIHNLIHSLNRAEVKFFRKIHQGTIYADVFNLIAAQEEYDEDAIKRKLGTGSSAAANLSKTKKRLFLEILNSTLTSGKSQFQFEQIMLYIPKIDFLLHKGLFDDAFDLINEAEILARKYDDTTTLLELNKRMVRIIENRKEEDMEEQLQYEMMKRKRIVEEQLNELKHMELQQQFYILINTLTTKNRGLILKRAEHLIDDPLLKDAANDIHFKSFRFYLLCWADYFFIIGDIKNSCASLLDLIRHVEDHWHFTEMNPHYITRVVYQYFNRKITVAESKPKLLDEFYQLLDNLPTIPKRNWRDSMHEFEYLKDIEVLLSLVAGDFNNLSNSEGEDFTKKVPLHLEVFTFIENHGSNMTPWKVIVMLFNLSSYYLLSNKPDRLSSITFLLDSLEIKVRPKRSRGIYLMWTLSVIDTGDVVKFEDAYIRTKQQMRLNYNPSVFELDTMKWLEQILKTTDRHERSKIYKEWYTWIQNESDTIARDEIYYWLKSKITGHSMYELYKMDLAK